MARKNPAAVSLSSVIGLLAISLLASAGALRAQAVQAQRAPLSPRFRAWVAQHEPRGVPAPAGGGKEGGMRVRGYIPPPVDLSHVHGPIFTAGAADPPFPAFYDLRTSGWLTPVKDQGEYGTCWTFACLGSLESSMLMGGLGVHDLSEWHLAYYAYTPFNASLLTSFTPGPMPSLEDPIFDQGGNDWMSTALLARGTGAVSEKDCPYQLGSYLPAPRPAGNLPNGREAVSVPLESALYLFNTDSPTSAADVKYAVTHYGPAVISMDWEDDKFDGAQNTYRDTTATEFDTNHEVCIVGWNDDFETCRFPANNRPSAPGAWIVRNSWSRYWGLNGYFYLSYDSKIFDGTVFLGGPRTTRRIHQYDPLGWCDSLGFGTATASCANVFQTQEREKITAVAFYAGQAGTAYELDLRTGVSGDPGTGVSASAAAGWPLQRGTLLAPGYHTVALDHPVTVPQGSFAVVLKLTTPGYSYPIPVQEPEPGYSDRAASEHGRSYISPDGSAWQDLSPDCHGAVVCLKALSEPA